MGKSEEPEIPIVLEGGEDAKMQFLAGSMAQNPSRNRSFRRGRDDGADRWQLCTLTMQCGKSPRSSELDFLINFRF